MKTKEKKQKKVGASIRLAENPNGTLRKEIGGGVVKVLEGRTIRKYKRGGGNWPGDPIREVYPTREAAERNF